jgi:macrolide transport system ATP-binding/permease protein
MGKSTFLIQATNLKKSYGDRLIFKIDSLRVSRGDRIGLVGPNGAGKSTLLSVLSGAARPDEGSLDLRCAAAVIRQEQDADEMRNAAPSAGNFARPVIKTPALSEKPSGGELSRAAIRDAFARDPDVLLADEPTTNLDESGIRELRDALSSFRGAIILISHDRSLLDDVCEKIWELENGSLREFPGNYSEWRRQKTVERDFAASEYEAYRSEKKRLVSAARGLGEISARALKAPSRMSRSEARIDPAKGTNAQAAIHARARAISRRAEMLESRERPADLPEIKMALGDSSRVASDVTIRAENLSVAFGGRVLLDCASFEVSTARRTVLMGPNGCGKSTLLDMITRGENDAIRIAPGARIGYFSQNSDFVAPSRTILENARQFSDRPEHEVRTILARLEIKGGDVHKRCSLLSGGERAKVAFAALFASGLNTLILDEPTNHIDLYTTEALEGLLAAWRGTLLLVTHDRRLARNTGERLLIFRDKTIKTFEGTLTEYENTARRS